MFTSIRFLTNKITTTKPLLLLTTLSLLSASALHAEQVSVLTTSGDTSVLLATQNPVSFQQGISEQAQAITLNEQQTYQHIDGLGFALTQASAKALMQLSDNEQNVILNELYNRDSGNGVSMVRVSIGASDLSSSLYTYNEANVSGDNFSPNASSRYYIDSPAHGLRLGATVNGEQPYTAINSPSGEDFQWQFVSSGDGHWYVERAAGGSLPRLRSDDTNLADMQATDSNGTWEKWQLSAGEGAGSYFLSLPLKGFGNHDRLQVDDAGLVRMVDNDQSAGTWESFTFTEVANSDNFSLAGPDQQYLLPILKKIRAINPEIKILATPWTAPRWMKTNNHWVGGELKTDHYDDYANYFANYLSAMAAQGLNVWGITVQNEPEHLHNEPSMGMTAAQQYNFINDHLGPLLQNSSHSQVKIIGFDHNLDNTSFPIQVAQSQYVDGSAFHLYAGEISAMSTVKQATGKNVYFTEQFTGFPKGSSEAEIISAFDGDFAWHLENVVIGSLRNWSKTVFEWNLVTSPPTTEHGCVVCMGAITLDDNNHAVTRNVAYYIISQLSKDLQAGAVRIDSGELNGDVHHVAFTNPDESIVLLAYNASSANSADMAINWRDKSFNYAIPARTAVTFKWHADETTDDIKVEAEDYIAMSGIAEENTIDIDGGENVGWIDSGDWMKYQVNIPTTSNYTISYRIASPTGASLQLQQDNNSFPSVTIPNTGDWQNWQTIEQTVFLNAGQQELTLTAPVGGWNINWFTLTANNNPVLDSDQDGVVDSVDNCPDTPANTPVDQRGCAIIDPEPDSDNDGVIDRLDHCPDTPANTSVDVNGCAIPTSSCNGINVYPNWTTTDYDGGPKTHHEAKDLMVFENNVYSAKWYTNSIPGSDNTWSFVQSCD